MCTNGHDCDGVLEPKLSKCNLIYSSSHRLALAHEGVYFNTATPVHHMEKDLSSDNILFLTPGILSSTNGRNAFLVHRSNRNFKLFAQTPGKKILLIDNSCIHMLDVRASSTSLFAGACHTTGDTNGERTSAKFHTLTDILAVSFRRNQFLICDSLNHKIKVLDIGSRFVTLLLNTERHQLTLPYSMIWYGNFLLVAGREGITQTKLEIRKEGVAAWPGKKMELIHQSANILRIMYTQVNYLIFFTKLHSTGLYILDMNKKQAISTDSLTIDLKNPDSLITFNCTLFIGTNRSIEAVRGEYTNSQLHNIHTHY